MSRIVLPAGAIATLFVSLMTVVTTPVQAQVLLARTYVSRTGNDDNNCGATTPCRSFQGAHDKTETSGVINCLNSSDFDNLTITKTITIDCGSVDGGMTLGGVTGITVNGSGIEVLIRGLEISGNGQFGSGIRFLNGKSLIVEDCLLHQQLLGTSTGILFTPSLASRLTVINSLIRRNGTIVDGANGGIVIMPTGVGYASVAIIDTEIIDNGTAAVLVDTSASTGSSTNVSITRSSLSNSQYGVYVIAPAGAAGGSATISKSNITGNTSVGLLASGPHSAIRVTDSVISGNSRGVQSLGGTLVSYGDNTLAGNGVNGTFSGVAPLN